MTEITISENEYNENNLLYLQTTLSELLANIECKQKCSLVGKRYKYTLICPDNYQDIIRAEIADKLAEIIAVRYKYEFFKKTIKLVGLSPLEKEILYVGLIAADLEDDKKYSFDRFKYMNEIAIDGTYNFKLQPLKRKWSDVASYMPNCFLPSQLKDFMIYLLENKKRRAYIDQENVYDSHFRRLRRCMLLEGEKAKIVREVLLSNCGEVELNGKIPIEDEKYIKDYYGEKIFFTTNF